MFRHRLLIFKDFEPLDKGEEVFLKYARRGFRCFPCFSMWAEKFNALIHSDEFKGLFADYKPRLTVSEVRGRVLLLSQEKYAEKPVGAYCEGWTSALELEKQKQGAT